MALNYSAINTFPTHLSQMGYIILVLVSLYITFSKKLVEGNDLQIQISLLHERRKRELSVLYILNFCCGWISMTGLFEVLNWFTLSMLNVQ